MKPSIRRLAVILTAIDISTSQAQTIIEPGKTFLLGGEQTQPLVVKGTNIGSVPVEISAEKNGQPKLITIVAPRADLFVTFATGELARFRNTSGSTAASVNFELTKEVSKLSMRYSE